MKDIYICTVYSLMRQTTIYWLYIPSLGHLTFLVALVCSDGEYQCLYNVLLFVSRWLQGVHVMSMRGLREITFPSVEGMN